MLKYFGTDGFRGIANKNFTSDHIYKLGRFIGWYYKYKIRCDNATVKVIVGKDPRISSYMFECALIGGLTSSGADVYLLNVTTTPSVAYIAKNDKFDCAIMITASHNLYYYNGIKIINGNGEKIEDDVIRLIEDYIDDKFKYIPFATYDKIGKIVNYVSEKQKYIKYLISKSICSFHGIKVGLDCANGAAYKIAKTVFDALGAEVHIINACPNGVNINENAGSTHIDVLKKYVIENNLDIGFAYDGDADRCCGVDEKGNFISGDHILYIYGSYMKHQNELINNMVVTTVMSNLGLFKAFDKIGIKYAKVDVGDKYIYECMKKHNCCLGGEPSGHIIFSKYSSTGDGILTSIKLLQVIILQKKMLSELISPLIFYPQVLVNVDVKDKHAIMSDHNVKKSIEKISNELGIDGRIIVRKSGTESIIRVMIEANSEQICRNYVDSIVDIIKSKNNILK